MSDVSGCTLGKRKGLTKETTYQHRRGPFTRVPGGIPLLVTSTVVPEGAAKVVQREVQLFGRVLVEGAKDTVVADKGLEAAAQRLALDPV